MDFYSCLFRTEECEESDCYICVFNDDDSEEEEE